MKTELRLRAFWAVRNGVDEWELIRDLTAALDAATTGLTDSLDADVQQSSVDAVPLRSTRHCPSPRA